MLNANQNLNAVDTNELRHEESWCAATCPMEEIEDELQKISALLQCDEDVAPVELIKRKSFLDGVYHARVIFLAATNGRIGR